ncbi:glycosyltransferase family 4 protein [Pannonibacter sp. Pt2-lr]|uniref:Glycosyltransferase family 4 protein n=1 Tax=Pannonibacter anstelovis TaxID=3121537 RepID=A0ABU7ZT14_9HYPH
MKSEASAPKAPVVFAFPGDLDTPTGGYGYDRRIIAGLRELGRDVKLLELGYGFPFPEQEVLSNAERALEALPDGTLLVVDGLAYALLGAAAARLAPRLTLVCLLHHPLCLESGLDPQTASQLEAAERDALRHAHEVIVTSHATAERVRVLFAVPSAHLHVVEPGTDRAPQAMGSGGPVLRLLAVGSIVPRKGYDVLVEALAGLTQFDWQLEVAGGILDEACHAAILQQIAAYGLEQRITLHGALSSTVLEAAYAAADLFVLASRYEGFGMAFTEALARGLPVIGSGGPAVERSLSGGGGIYVLPGSVEDLREALRRLMTGSALRQQLAAEARAAAERMPDWTEAARQFSDALDAAGIRIPA